MTATSLRPIWSDWKVIHRESGPTNEGFRWLWTSPRLLLPAVCNRLKLTPGATVTPLPQGTQGAQDPQFGPSPAQPTPGSVGVAPAEMTPTVSIDPTVAAPAQDVPAVNTQPATKPETAKTGFSEGLCSSIRRQYQRNRQKSLRRQGRRKAEKYRCYIRSQPKTLASIDSLQVGQKLTIPPIAGSTAASSTPADVLTDKNFTKVESVGQQNSTAKQTTATSKPAAAAKTGNVYVVKEGDSLWKIASTQLGDGNRYREIVKINSDILSSEDDIAVGMQLKMPAK